MAAIISLFRCFNFFPYSRLLKKRLQTRLPAGRSIITPAFNET